MYLCQSIRMTVMTMGRRTFASLPVDLKRRPVIGEASWVATRVFDWDERARNEAIILMGGETKDEKGGRGDESEKKMRERKKGE
jgi:hypothetical protein